MDYSNLIGMSAAVPRHLAAGPVASGIVASHFVCWMIQWMIWKVLVGRFPSDLAASLGCRLALLLVQLPPCVAAQMMGHTQTDKWIRICVID